MSLPAERAVRVEPSPGRDPAMLATRQYWEQAVSAAAIGGASAGTSALLVSTATQWYGAARMSRCLAKAGFTVSLLTPRNSPAEKSRFISHFGYLPDSATPIDWVHAFAAMVETTSPHIVLPCDDTALRLMQTLVLAPPQDLPSAQHLQLAALIATSLGTPAHYRASIDKTLISPLAESLGIRVPPYIVTSDLGEVQSFVLRHGYPLVLKRRYSSAGQGVAVCNSHAEVTREFATLSQPDRIELDDTPDNAVLAQAYVPGRTHYHNSVAWQGVACRGCCRADGVDFARPGERRAVFLLAGIAPISATLATGLGLSGIYVPEFIVHETTGDAYLIEVNRRMTQGTHRSAVFGLDLGAALYAAVNDLPQTTRADLDPGEEHFVAHFPLEWMRDSDSPYLREYPVDVPWDEPELMRALISRARESFRSAS